MVPSLKRRREISLKRIFVTGGAGYVGAVLVPQLLSLGYSVSVIDLMIYGNDILKPHRNLNLIRGDIRDVGLLESSIPGHDAVIHLACISNDPSFDLNPELGKSINLDAFRPLVEISRDSGIARFIYASTGAVYGVKDEPNVHEEMTLEPLTDYAKYKAACENILFEYNDENFTSVAVRFATVCGCSPRQRLDVVVNILTNLAYHNREITVFGGEQLRPNVHIDDAVRLYTTLLDLPDMDINRKVFNVCSENSSINDLAHLVKDVVGEDVRLVKTETDDIRSYHLSNKKIEDEIGFVCRKSVRDAVVELTNSFANGKIRNSLTDDVYFNVRRMQNINMS